MDLKGKVALVTGGTGGIGRACVEELLKHGAKVSICDLNMAEGEHAVKQLSVKYGKDRVLFCQCDVTDYPQFEESFQTTIAALGGLDIVVNNAGIMNDRLWELEVDVNLNGLIRGTLLALRFMGKDRGGRGGVIINMGSNVSLRPYVSLPIYTATKHAIVGFTRSYGDVYHANTTGVRIIALCPSATDTKLVQEVKKQLLSAEFEKAWQRDTANSLPQKAECVGKALVQILHKAASGTVWSVENGQPPYQVNFS
ncbi:hypothetical protein ONE63_006526 [Megalurothrips usitatus]|uniref:15-hydroxyprostaglandin dehydrogenase [NAD(+)] n=1 Tax=Megalurothrips usitatus TaxID=439358 RepID=A0AAV7XX25_9NEOP|nr:hypothetical protein ONE63_006526 [Megalurothrips usitatus]